MAWTQIIYRYFVFHGILQKGNSYFVPYTQIIYIFSQIVYFYLVFCGILQKQIACWWYLNMNSFYSAEFCKKAIAYFLKTKISPYFYYFSLCPFTPYAKCRYAECRDTEKEASTSQFYLLVKKVVFRRF